MSIHDKAETQLTVCCAYTAAATVHENQDAYAVDVDNFRFVITDGATGRPRGREWATHLAQFWIEHPGVTSASWLSDLKDGFQESQDGSVSTLVGLSLSSDGTRVVVDGAGDCFCLRVSKEHGLRVAFHGNIESAIGSDQSNGLDITQLECPADSGDYFILASDAIGHLLTTRWATKSADFIYSETERFIDQDWDTFLRNARLGSYGPTLVDDDVTIVICKATVTKVVEPSRAATRKLTFDAKVVAVAIVCIAVGITVGWMVKGPSDPSTGQVASKQSSMPIDKPRQSTQVTEEDPKTKLDIPTNPVGSIGLNGSAQKSNEQQITRNADGYKKSQPPKYIMPSENSSRSQVKKKVDGQPEHKATEKKPTDQVHVTSTKQSGLVGDIRNDKPISIEGFISAGLEPYSDKVTFSEWEEFIGRNKVDRNAYQRVGDLVKANKASAKKYIEWRNKVSSSSNSSGNWRLYDGDPEYNELKDCVHHGASLAFIRAYND